MEAALFVLREAGAKLEIETIEVGARVYTMGGITGILPSSWISLHRTKLLLKGPTVAPAEGYEDVTAAILKRMALDETHRRDADIEGASAHAYAGEHFTLFETPRNATLQDMLLAATMLLEHTGQGDIAADIHEAWRETIQDNIDAQNPHAFAEAVVARLKHKSPSSLLYKDLLATSQ